MITARSIDFEAGLVIVESLKKRRKFVYRAVPLPASLLQTLRQFTRKAEIDEAGRLWPWSRMTGYRRITEIMKKADIVGPWATPKGLRHGFGVRAVQSGAPLHMVQRWLGHADMKTTAIYASAVGPEEREIASRTWLTEEDDQKDRATERHQAALRESELPHPESLPDIEAPEPQDLDYKIERKLLVRRILSRIMLACSCQMIHFYLFCHKYFGLFS